MVDDLVLLSQLKQVLQMPFGYLLDTGKRVHILYLFSSLLIALVVFKYSGGKGSFWKYTFSKKYWWSKSAQIDYGLLFVNSLIKVFLIAPYLLYVGVLAHWLAGEMNASFGEHEQVQNPMPLVLAYTFCLIVVNDFFSFITHYLMHFVPFLWRFHQVHHSATSLNPFTQYRLHPVELIINNARGIVVKGVLTGLFMYWAGGSISLVTFLGINILNFVFLFTGANLRHTHIPFKYFNFLEYILISPYQHQIHHSNNKAHFNTNMGSRFAIWDWLFGCLLRSEQVSEIRFGLGGEADNKMNSLWKNLAHPFKLVQ